MPRGDKSKYTGKQKRKADHIAEGYESRGVPEKEAERIAWATVNKESGGGKKSGSGPRSTGIPRLIAKGRPTWGPSICQPASGRAFSCGQEGRGDPQAPCFVVNARHHDCVHSPNHSAGMELCFRFAIRRWETVKETTKCFLPV